MTDTPTFNRDEVVFVGLSHFVAERDGCSVEEAGQRLANLFNSPEVQAQVEQEKANAPETKLAVAEEKLVEAAASIQAILDALRGGG